MITSVEEFASLRLDTDPEKYRRAANESASDEIWFEIVDRFPELRKWVAHNKTVPIVVLDLLSRDPDPEVRFFVAMKNKLPIELFARLSIDPDYSVRSRIAWNRKTPLDILKRLALDSEPTIAKIAEGRLAEDATSQN